MNANRTSRPIPLFLTALVAFCAALAALATSNGRAHAHGNAAHAEHGAAVAQSPRLTPKAVAFVADMRKLWEDHITWTRLAIISLEGGTPDTNATVARLLRNQADLGNAVRPFYGRAAGDKLTQLLRQHILVGPTSSAPRRSPRSAATSASTSWTASSSWSSPEATRTPRCPGCARTSTAAPPAARSTTACTRSSPTSRRRSGPS